MDDFHGYPATVSHVVDLKSVVVNRGHLDGVRSGDRFLFFRLSEEPIVDPVTGKSLGYLELVLGTGVATHVQERMATITSDQKGLPTRTVVKRKSPLGIVLDTEEETIIAPAESVPFDDVRVGDRAKPVQPRPSKQLALLLVSSELDRAIARIVSTLGLRSKWKPETLQAGFEILAEQKFLPRSVAQNGNRFVALRNDAVHGVNPSDDDYDMTRRLGEQLLEQLRKVPTPSYEVVVPRLLLYADEKGSQLREGVWGVMLRMVPTNEEPAQVRVYPTTQKYVSGMRVSWEWHSGNKLGETWYREPTSKALEYAWSESMEFVGRDLAIIERGLPASTD